MPKESFEQFVRRQKEKLDKAKKMIREVKKDLEDLEKKIEEFIEKPLKDLKRLWEENEEEIEKKDDWVTAFSFLFSLPFPETSPSFLERISNKFLKEFDWKKFEKKGFLRGGLGLFLSAFLKKNIESYISSQKEKGIKEENIKPIEVHLKVKELPIPLWCLGYQNPKKLHLIIEGDCGEFTGEKTQGGKIIVEGDCEGCWTGRYMQGGKIIVKGSCRDWTGEKMQGGKIIIEGNCGRGTGICMKGGELDIKGKVVSFERSSTFSPNNQGTIIWKGIKIWENGNWTKEGKEMWERGEIPVE